MRSGFERTLAAQLKTAKVTFGYESLKIPYVIKHTYVADFHLVINGVVIEAKGFFRDASEPRKYLAVREQNPDIDLRFVFMNAHHKIPFLKSTYAEWADKHKFQWADAKIPPEWLK